MEDCAAPAIFHLQSSILNLPFLRVLRGEIETYRFTEAAHLGSLAGKCLPTISSNSMAFKHHCAVSLVDAPGTSSTGMGTSAPAIFLAGNAWLEPRLVA